RYGHDAGAEVSHISLQVDQGRWHFSGDVDGGRLDAWGKGSKGELTLNEVPADACFKLVDLEGASGVLSGHLGWSGQGVDEWIASGTGKWQSADGRGQPGTISLNMRIGSSGRELRLRTRHWPVHGWHGHLSSVGMVHVSKAWLDTAIEYREDHGTWHLQGGEGGLRDVRGSVGGEPEQRPFRFESLSWTSCELDDRGRLALAGLEIVGGEVSLPVAAAQSQETSYTMRLFASDVSIRDMVLHWHQGQRVLSLPLLEGTLDIEPHMMGFDLASRDDVQPQWRVQGRWAFNPAMQVRSFQTDILGKGLPLQEMIPVLSAGMPGLKELPLSMSGFLDIRWQLAWDGEHLSVTGEVGLQDFKARHGSAQWRAEHIKAHFRIHDHQRHVGTMEVHGWHYLVPLVPMRVAMPNSDAPDEHPWLELIRAGSWSIDSLRLEDGSIAVGEEEDIWARDLLLRLQGLKPGKPARMELTGRLGEGDLTASFEVQPYRQPLQWYGVLHVRSALPFLLRRWLKASGMPVLLRGRWWLEVRVVTTEQNGYSLSGRFQLLRPLWMSGERQEHDPMLARTGLSSEELLLWLDHVSKKDGFRWGREGLWEKDPLSWWGILSTALNQVREANSGNAARPVKAAERIVQTALLRLHDQSGLSHNERLRVFKVIRRVRANKGWFLDLQPEIASRSLDASAMLRIRRTQRLVEDYAAKHGLDRSRIFPVWPVGTKDGPEVGAIRVQAVAPPSGS
ncbi:MAG: hypothetical protein D6703_01525, partial [Zetaproteobacteria bacterium]